MVKLRVGKQSTTAQLSTESYSDVYPDLGTTCNGKAYLFKLRRPFTFLFLQLWNCKANGLYLFSHHFWSNCTFDNRLSYSQRIIRIYTLFSLVFFSRDCTYFVFFAFLLHTTKMFVDCSLARMCAFCFKIILDRENSKLYSKKFVGPSSDSRCFTYIVYDIIFHIRQLWLIVELKYSRW